MLFIYQSEPYQALGVNETRFICCGSGVGMKSVIMVRTVLVSVFCITYVMNVKSELRSSCLFYTSALDLMNFPFVGCIMTSEASFEIDHEVFRRFQLCTN